MTTEHLVAETTVANLPADTGPMGAVLVEAAESLEVLPAWSRTEPEGVTDPEGVDERRADAVAEALAAPPELPPDPTNTSYGGAELPPAFRRWAEQRTGVDLGQVRLHRSEDGNRQAQQLRARAFTKGADIVLGPQVAPIHTQPGLHTLAHEIGHVVAPPRGGRIGRDDPPAPTPGAWNLFVPNSDVIELIKSLPELLDSMTEFNWDATALATWDKAATDAGAPQNSLYPEHVVIVAESHVVSVSPKGAVEEVIVRDPAGPYQPGQNAAFVLADLSTGWSRSLGSVVGTDDKDHFSFRPTNKRNPVPNAKPGQSLLFVLLPGVTLTEAQLKALSKKSGGAAAPKTNTSDTPPWTKDQVSKLKQAKGKKGAGAGDKKGTKDGSPTGQGKGDTGEGKGAGTGRGDGTGPGEKGEGEPSGGGPLKGPVDYSTWQGEKGPPQLVITQDRAWTSIPLIENESTDSLEARADAALEKLQASRDPANGQRVADGVTETAFVEKKGSTEGVAQSAAEAEKQAESTPTATTPGEQVGTGKGGIANAPEYPSKMTMAGHDPQFAAMTTSGATNEFTMDLDYAALSMGLQDEVFNRMQTVQFYWEVINVTGLTKAKAEELAEKNQLPKGEQATPGGAMGTNFSRDMNAIAEDQANDIQMMSEDDWPWEARAAYLTVIGVSNVVRMVGSIIGSFIDVLTQPLNARSIGFDEDGDYIVRCVATPIPSDEAREDPAHHVIRKSSIAVLPIRVGTIKERATEAVDREAVALAEKEAALVAAQKTGEALKIERAASEVEALKKAKGRSGYEEFQARLNYLRDQLRIAQAFKKHRDGGVDREQWGDDEIELAIRLLAQKIRLEQYITDMEKNIKALGGEDGEHETWVKEQLGKFVDVGGRKEFRPRVVLASEETGQVTDVLCMLGQVSSGADAPWRWVLVDITSPGSRDYYTGTSSIKGAAGRSAAIRDAFRNFAEKAGYGRGTLALRMPADLIAAAGPLDIESEMRSAPGGGDRMLRRLADLARVAMIAGLFVTGPLGVVIGAAGGVAGAVVAVDALVKRARTAHLLEIGTVFDVLGVVGGIASTLQVGAMLARNTADGLAKLGKTPTWLKGLEKTEKALHIHAQVGIVQQVVSIPITLVVEWTKIEESSDTPGKKNSRKLRAILSALENGTITIAMLGGGPAAKAKAGAAEPATKVPGGSEAPAPKGSGAKDAHAHADGSGPAKPPVVDPDPVRPAVPDEPAPPPKSRQEIVDEARALAAKRVGEARQGEREAANKGDEEVITGEEGRTAVGTPRPTAPPKVKGDPDPHAAARKDAVDILQSRLGKEIPTPAPPQGTKPPPTGPYGARTKSAKEALASYDKAVSEANGREVGLFFNDTTGEFQVMVGTENQVMNPHVDGWHALVHLHPNPENVITMRLPAPADILGAVRAAMNTGSHTEYVQSTRPDGSTGLTKVTVTIPPLKIVVEMPASPGEPARRIEAGSGDEYVKEYGRDATYMDPDGATYKWVMRDLDDYYRLKRREEGRTAVGTGTNPAATKPAPGAHDEAIAKTREHLEQLRDRAKDPAEKKVYDDDLATLDKLKEDAAKGEDITERLGNLNEVLGEHNKTFAPVPVSKVQTLADRARKNAAKTTKKELKRELLRIAGEADELAQKMQKDPKHDPREKYNALRRQERVADVQEGSVVFDLSDAVLRQQVIDWIESKAGRLKDDLVGDLLVAEILKHIDTADTLVLSQSPRSSGKGAADTPEMRQAVLEGVKNGRYPQEYVAAFEAAVKLGEKQGKKDGWPRDTAGNSWEVDHVAELWLGGGDDIRNYMALPENVHALKSALFAKFMNEFRSRRVTDEQVDVRASEPKVKK